MAAIDTAQERAALRQCAAAVLRAQDGRGVRWARTTCMRMLVAAGHGPDAANVLTQHHINWLVPFAHSTRRLVAQFNASRPAPLAPVMTTH